MPPEMALGLRNRVVGAYEITAQIGAVASALFGACASEPAAA